MTIFSTLGLTESNSTKVSHGRGHIYQRTVELGDDILAIDNIGSMRTIDERKNHALTVVGILIALPGLPYLFGPSKMMGFIIVLLGGGLAAWNILRKMETYLSIGTCDGKSTVIVSKNRAFLVEVSHFIRKKIDTESLDGATINIENSVLEGTFAIGSGGSARSSSG